jgi:hypothetical protein
VTWKRSKSEVPRQSGSVLVLGLGRRVYILVGDMVSKTHENLPVFTKIEEIGVY